MQLSLSSPSVTSLLPSAQASMKYSPSAVPGGMVNVSVSLNTPPAMSGAGTVAVDGPCKSCRVAGVAVETRLNLVRVGMSVATGPMFFT